MTEINVQKKNVGTPQAPIARRELEPFRLARELFGWDPFREMAPIWSGEVAAYSPAFEVKETKDAFSFKADVPGIKDADLEVTVANNRLTVSGKREAEKEQKEDTYYTYERSYGTFSRTFTLPPEADVAHLRAELKDGVLTVVAPKTAAAVAKRIPVTSGETSKA
jgi:HSP20 family protein